MFKSIMLLLGLIVFITVILVFGPLAIIWALNTLFGLGIPYTFWTWLSVTVLNLTWAGGLSRLQGVKK